jgi:hypothetical protein
MGERASVLTDRPVLRTRTESPDISVCIANWNCRDMLRDCLESLRCAAGVRLEVIVVDNASSDGAADMVAVDFPEVVLVRNAANTGFAHACNQAAKRTRGRYLLFLNNDTIVPPPTLRQLLEYAEAHPGVGMVGPRLEGAGGRTQVSCRPRPTAATLLHRTALLRWTGLLRGAYRRYRRAGITEASRPRHVETLMGAAVLLPRAVFFEVGGWDEEYTFGGEDFDLSTRVGRRHAVVYFPGATITHFGRASTRANVSYSAPNVAIGFARYLRKSGGSGAELFLYKTLITLDAPLQLAGKTVQWLWRRLCGKEQKARQSSQRIKELWYFLTRGLGAFWRV